MTETWAPVNGKDREYWKPEKAGDERIGTLLRGEAGEYKGKPTMQYVLDVDGGKELYTPNHAILNTKLLTVKVGCRVRVVYKGPGVKKKGKNAAELYDVFVSDAPRVTQTALGTAEEFSQPTYKPQDERIKAALDDIRLYCKLDHIIPEEKLKKICGDEATFNHLRDQGLICMSSWDKVEGWRAT